jgi:hypothetical protein
VAQNFLLSKQLFRLVCPWMYVRKWLLYVTIARKVRIHATISQQLPHVRSHPSHPEHAYDYWPKSTHLVS